MTVAVDAVGLSQLAAFTVGMLHVLMACAAWLLIRGPRQARALQLWSAGTLALGIGLAPGGLVDPPAAGLPDGVRLGLLPALLMVALLLRVLALRRHLGRPPRLGAGMAIGVPVALGWALCLQSDDPLVRQSYANAVLIVGTAVTGRYAWDDNRGSSSGARTARWLACTEWLLTAALVVRAIAMAATASVGGRWDWWLVLAAAALAALFGNLGFLGMVMDDLHRAELQARQAQIDETASREAAEQTALALQALLGQRDALADEHERLLQTLAHEIRAPLQSAEQAMQGAVQVLHAPRGARAAEVSARLLQVQAVLGDVRAVLDNTLAAATLLSREAPLVRQDVALDFLVELTLGDLSPRQVDRLTVEWLTDVDSVEVEPGLVRLALRNLLLNAFVHGGPQVQVSLRLDELPTPRRLRLVVSDDGPGMAAERLLARPPAEQPSRQPLGLNIVRQVMDLHGGELILGNTLPRGFLAQLVFPLPADDLDDDGSPTTAIDADIDTDIDTDMDDDGAHGTGWLDPPGAARKAAQACSSGARKT